jgi:hypothetical protein
MAAQTVRPRNWVSIGASLMVFAQALFGVIFVSVGQHVLDGELAKRLLTYTIVSSKQIEAAGVTRLWETLPGTRPGPESLQCLSARMLPCWPHHSLSYYIGRIHYGICSFKKETNMLTNKSDIDQQETVESQKTTVSFHHDYWSLLLWRLPVINGSSQPYR